MYGPGTARATRTVQAHLHLTQDGVVGPRTRSAVSELGFATGAGGTTPSSSAHAGERRLCAGMRGADVEDWQRLIDLAIRLDRLDHARGPGRRVRAQHPPGHVALQTRLEVTADGVVGPVTREATGWLLEG